jgi:hypothetical protein
MPTVTDLHQELAVTLDRYADRYINQHLPVDPQAVPADFELDVRSYCLLSHAALEEYFEEVVLAIADSAIDQWKNAAVLSRALVMLLVRYGMTAGISDEDEGENVKVYDHIRGLAAQAKVRFSDDVHGNHGASPRYLRRLLVPVGLDFLPDANTLDSLTRLARVRGAYAHHGAVKTVTSPEDARNYVSDCRAFAATVRDNAVSTGLVL